MNRIGAWMGWVVAVTALLGTSCAGPKPFTGFRTTDGFTIAADLLLPETTPAPLVVLGHQVGRDRRSWDPLVPRLVEAGYAVVRVDHRAFGESRREVAQPDELDYEQKNNLYLDLLGAIEEVASRPEVDASRIAVVGTGLSMNAAVQCAVRIPAVRALVLMSGALQRDEMLELIERPEMPLLLIAASGDARGTSLMSNYAGRFLGPQQRYVKFEPIDENDPCNWEGTDGLVPETGLADLLMWFLSENFPAAE